MYSALPFAIIRMFQLWSSGCHVLVVLPLGHQSGPIIDSAVSNRLPEELKGTPCSSFFRRCWHCKPCLLLWAMKSCFFSSVGVRLLGLFYCGFNL